MKPSDFKVGDRVRIDCPSSAYCHGLTGTITDTGDKTFVGASIDALEGHRSYWFNPSQCKLISPQSPQTQTTQQKEDTVMYSVINYSHLTGGVNVTNYNTEAEAKTFAERTIASYRSNIQVKQYFTVSIIELKTGKLVGSVVDAPPAVDWATS